MDDQELLSAPLEALLAAAAQRRDNTFANVLTYSPKVFIPLTMLCRDKCGYCTFAQPPARLEQPYLKPDEVLEIARGGAALGCHEALFTLGERPELRYPLAQEWLATQGYQSTVDYVLAMAQLVLDETGLLPHANTGAMYANELHELRRVAPSQGMMLETIRADLQCHRGAPDKTPQRRLATLRAAGELSIPFTTGILVGIGEARADRVAALRAIAELHRQYGHIQEVIVQNFLPKARTAMQGAQPCSHAEHLEAIAWARLILPDDVTVQAPPNLSDELLELIAAGINDWGGVSPLTVDHVNPERPWPSLAKLRKLTENAGFNLTPRLGIHPTYARDPHTWIDERLHFAVMDRSDSQGYARDDPGSVWPERTMLKTDVGDGAECELVDEQSTQWYVGAKRSPCQLVPAYAQANGAVGEVLEGVRSGEDLGFDEIVTLFAARGAEVAAVAEVADELRATLNGDEVTWVANRNINYTNVCTFRCKFCGFSKGPLSLNLRGKPYLLTLQEIAQRSIEAAHAGATEVCLQGGIHPDFDGDYYIDVARAVHEAVPGMHIHGFTALEVTEGAKRNQEPLADYLTRLREAGQRSLPGTAAEILHDEVRQVLCPDKITSEEWLEAHRTAHAVGLRSNVTIMFGSIERPEHWAQHLLCTRALQEETGGFTEFVGLPFVHMAAPIYLRGGARRGPTWREVLLMHAVARIAYRGRINNIQASWVKLGFEAIQQLLRCGVNDLGGTLMDENISRAAGAAHGITVSETDFRDVVEPLGRRLTQRTTLYGRVNAADLPLSTRRAGRASIPLAPLATVG
ncbi:MAG: bifunctional FO biosynthesis protein CofGH [Acidimicrobiia bacterium]|nr:bifunctional FO biosynthesis protein CofGH [Acidimicrobiia bacterium]